MYNVDLTESYFPAQEGPDLPPMTVGDMLRASAGKWPNQMALQELSITGDHGRSWTYAELLKDSERLARALATRHVEGARIAVYAHNIPEWILIEMACGLAGVTLVTVNPAFQPRELDYVLTQSGAEAIYYVEEHRGNPMKEIVAQVCAGRDEIKHKIVLTDHDAMFEGENTGELRSPKPSDAVQIQYTSGTTGFPKGALLHHNGLVRNAADAIARGGLEPGDKIVHHMPLFHTTGCAVMVLGVLSAGGTMLLVPVFDPVMIVKVISRERVRSVVGVATMIVAMIAVVEQTGMDVSSVERVMSGGAMVPPELCRRSQKVLGAPIQIIYGQTECSPVVTSAWFDDTLEDQTQTIGQPLPRVEVAILDPNTNEVTPVGVQGEICVRGYLVMTEYNDNPEATAAAIDKDRWLHTGDLGSMDSRGYVKITGRVKEMIIRGGENLFPVEIENALLEHSDIEEVAVVGVPDETWGEQVVCFMRSGSGNEPDGVALKAFVRERLSPQKTPAFWVWVKEWPLTGSGKIQKFKLRDMYVAGEFA